MCACVWSWGGNSLVDFGDVLLGRNIGPGGTEDVQKVVWLSELVAGLLNEKSMFL